MASVAWSTVLDAVLRAQRIPGMSGDGRGLRGDQSAGTLRFHGVLHTPGKPDGQVRGTIDGRPVALLVPMNWVPMD